MNRATRLRADPAASPLNALRTPPPLPAGWHPLPGGGALYVAAGVPQLLSDGRRWNADEQVLLGEAASLTGMHLELEADRAARWHRPSPFDRRQRHRHFDERIARVRLGPCARCGVEAGRAWWVGPDVGPAWVCDGCGIDLVRGLDGDA